MRNVITGRLRAFEMHITAEIRSFRVHCKLVVFFTQGVCCPFYYLYWHQDDLMKTEPVRAYARVFLVLAADDVL